MCDTTSKKGVGNKTIPMFTFSHLDPWCNPLFALKAKKTLLPKHFETRSTTLTVFLFLVSEIITNTTNNNNYLS